MNAAAIRCPNACTEPCDFPTCECHGKRGQVSEADLDAANADKTEAALRAAVCEAYADPQAAVDEFPPLNRWTALVGVTCIAAVVGYCCLMQGAV